MAIHTVNRCQCSYNPPSPVRLHRLYQIPSPIPNFLWETIPRASRGSVVHLGTSYNLSWRGEWRRNCFLFQIFSRPPLIAPMFFRYPPPPSIMLKDLRAPFLIHNTQMVITNNIFFSLPFLLTVTSECAN